MYPHLRKRSDAPARKIAKVHKDGYFPKLVNDELPSLPPLLSSALPLEVGHLNIAMGLEERCKLPQWALGLCPSRQTNQSTWAVSPPKIGSKGVQPVPKAVYCSICRDEHNRYPSHLQLCTFSLYRYSIAPTQCLLAEWGSV